VAQLVILGVIGLAGVVSGIVALAIGEIQGLLLLGGGCVAGAMAVWTPHRATLDDTGIGLRAVARRVHIPWDDLRSVAPPWWDIRHQWLKWGRRGRLPVLTLQAFPDAHRLLSEIGRRAPKVYVES
jgi:hypothetical protein